MSERRRGGGPGGFAAWAGADGPATDLLGFWGNPQGPESVGGPAGGGAGSAGGPISGPLGPGRAGALRGAGGLRRHPGPAQVDPAHLRFQHKPYALQARAFTGLALALARLRRSPTVKCPRFAI